MLKIISRKSPLAQLQVKELNALLPEIEFDVTFVESLGDKNLSISLMDSSVDGDFFTRELDHSILNETVDIAVHSAKDLQFPLPNGLELLALTKSADKSDSLVSRDNLTLELLPQGAKLGTSSVSRREQILELRPDLEIVSIRGAIDERIEYIERGECDAVIVATCALNRLNLDHKIAERLSISTHDLQGNLAIIGKSGRFDLQALFAPIDCRRDFGVVTLVGAGPGDPELVTRKAEKAIRSADIVFYDALINDELITWITGEKVFVGKRKGEHSLLQSEINRVLYEAALSGKSVVRLKCGDPLLFSRGGEEIDYLSERMISVNVIPGISSFQGCAASMCMPLTKRKTARSLNAISAHYETPAEIPVSPSGTQVIFMGVTKATDIQEALRQKSWSENTPIKIVSRGTYDDEQIFSTTVSSLHTVIAPAPAMIIVGDVTSNVREQKKVLFTGLDPSRSAVAGKIVHQPLIELTPMELNPAKTPIMDIYEGFIFTSKAAVNYFFDRWNVEAFATVVAIGPHTAKEIEKHGVKVDFIPEVFDSSHIGEIIRTSGARTWLYPCSNRSNNPIHSVSCVESFPLYETKFCNVTPLDLKQFSAIVFSSPSTVDSFLENYKELPSDKYLIVYGEPTAKKLESLGIERSQIVISPILQSKD